MMHFCCTNEDLFLLLQTVQTLMKCCIYVAFHLGLNCLPKYLFAGIQNENVTLSLLSSFFFRIKLTKQNFVRGGRGPKKNYFLLSNQHISQRAMGSNCFRGVRTSVSKETHNNLRFSKKGDPLSHPLDPPMQ